MNIVVCVKQVPDTNEVKIDPVKGTLIRDGVPSIINPDDKNAIEEALALKDKHGAKVTVITMGPPQAEVALKEAIAMGADDAILVSDRAFAGSDTLATSRTLAGAIAKLDYDIVMAGRQAIDGDTAQVGPGIAESLGLPQVTYVENVEVEGKSLKIRKALEDGYEMLEIQTPCLLTAIDSLNEPRYMQMKNIFTAYDKEVTMWNASDIDVNPEHLGLKGSPTKVKKTWTKEVKGAGELVELPAKDAAAVALSKLKEKHYI
ncbi:electron transfer flavoprotein beta subunit [Dethiosulfatibacter aminovorans DSM 17477]|uniref:Electron transfer flavoprotein small subunit n=1 Tax=Dethiosulfatibacter aminovorans DSM 17477 TaxID=1121476 RepID=A0A1M6HEF8_9FIRM|nr:electron transfer flavoprotein subunit beta/FixA family protein [Dethiosulfatibacter aminovorans]SHJ20577.1 electron transfer flavoprotein beta subunit [Dethiosulfatibacter aminovorans DSM 17477]